MTYSMLYLLKPKGESNAAKTIDDTIDKIRRSNYITINKPAILPTS